MGLINRTIFFELLKVFLLSLSGLTGLFLIGGLIQSAAQMGLSPAQVLRVIPLIIPKSLPYTIPATTLFASCVVYGRLANDNEAVALKAAGVDLLTVLRPALVLGLLTAGVTGALSYSVIPQTEQMVAAEVLKDPEEVLYNLLKRDRRLNNMKFEYAIFVRDVQNRRLIDVVVKKKSGVDQSNLGTYQVVYDFVARAREARLVVDREAGTLKIDSHQWVVDGPGTSGVTEGFEPPTVALPDEMIGKGKLKKPQSLEWWAIGSRLDELAVERAAVVATREEFAEKSRTDPNPGRRQWFTEQDPLFVEQIKDKDRQARITAYEYHIRPALAVGCVFFAVIGCPVGLWANRADYLSVFVMCFLPAILIYYPVLFAAGGLARDGKLPLAVGVWAADAVAAVATLALSWLLIRR